MLKNKRIGIANASITELAGCKVLGMNTLVAKHQNNKTAPSLNYHIISNIPDDVKLRRISMQPYSIRRQWRNFVLMWCMCLQKWTDHTKLREMDEASISRRTSRPLRGVRTIAPGGKMGRPYYDAILIIAKGLLLVGLNWCDEDGIAAQCRPLHHTLHSLYDPYLSKLLCWLALMKSHANH